MTMTQLRNLWHDVYNNKPYSRSRVFLTKHLAYRLQEIALERHDEALLQRNKARIQALMDTETEKQKVVKKGAMALQPGTVLTKVYQGNTHQVTVIQDGQFEFNNRLYGNLSVIAREITGTRWSGPVFFNLRKTTRNKPTRKSS